MDTNTAYIDARAATELWSGDLAIIGGSFAALEAALACRQQNPQTRICILESTANLGREISQEWRPEMPGGLVGKALSKTLQELGIPKSGQPDLVGATLAGDEIVRQNHLDAFVKVQPTRPIFHASGILRGVEVVGKSGRQLVSATTLLDASPGRAFSRHFLGLAPRRVLQTTHAIYLACVGDLPGTSLAVPSSFGLVDNLVCFAAASWAGEAILRFSLPVAPGQTSDLFHACGLETGMKLTSWLRDNQPGFQEATLVDVAPQPAVTYAPASDDLTKLQKYGILPLPEHDDWTTELRGAATIDLTATSISEPYFSASTPLDENTLQSSELAANQDQDLPAVILPAAPVQIHAGVQVAIAGYGVAGAFAAAAAAQEGMQVAVIDPATLPGGIATIGRVHSYYHGLPGGLQDKLDQQTDAWAEKTASKVRGYHPMARAQVLFEAMRAEGRCQLLPEQVVFGVIKEDNRVCGLLSAAADGYHLFPCQVAIDATGDGDVAAAAGAATILGRDGDGAPQPYSYTPSRLQDGKTLGHHNFDAGWVDPTDTTEFSRAHFDGRKTIHDMGPFTPENHYCTIGSIIGLRESRFLVGRQNINYDDFLEGRSWPDAVCSSSAHHDNHAMDYAEESRWAWEHVIMFGLWRYASHGQIPYGTMLPVEVEGLLVTGRALAVDHDLHQLVRMQRDMQVFGEICGVAAAEAIKAEVMVGDVHVPTLQEKLATRGIKPLEAVKSLDLPVPELLAALTCEPENDPAQIARRGLAMRRLSKLKGADGDFWPDFFATATDSTRFAGAVAAALGGHDLAPVRECLAETLAARSTDPRLGLKSAPLFVVAALALAELKGAAAAEDLAALLAEWRPGTAMEASDLLLILKALGQTGNPKVAIPAIRDFVVRWHEEPFAILLWGVRAGQPVTSIRHAIILRAARSLIQLGDQDGVQLCLPYLRDPRLLVRRLARRICAENGK